MSVFRDLMTRAAELAAPIATFSSDFRIHDENPMKWTVSLRNEAMDLVAQGNGPSGEAALRMAVEALHGT